MTINQDIKLGEFRTTINNTTRIWDILFGKNYGFVCIGLGTTNGSLSVLTEILLAKFKDMEQQKKELNDPSYEVEIHLTKQSEQFNLRSMWRTVEPIMMK